MAKGRGIKVNRRDLAATFGVTPPTIDSWVRLGAPFDERGAGKGKPWVFDTADVSAWLEARAAAAAPGGTANADAETLKLRKLSAETQIVELALAKDQELVAPLDQVERTLTRLFAQVRGSLRNIPSRCASLVVGENDERKIKATLLAEVDLVLEALAKFDLLADPDAEDDDEATDDETYDDA